MFELLEILASAFSALTYWRSIVWVVGGMSLLRILSAD